MMKNAVFNKCEINSEEGEKSQENLKFIEKKKFIHLSDKIGRLHDLSNALHQHCYLEELQ